MVGLRRCARGQCIQRGANRIVMAVSRWLWVVGLRRCARAKCMHRVENRIVLVVSRWLWVVDLRRCARGQCIQRGASRIVMVVSRWLWIEISIEKGRESRDFKRKSAEKVEISIESVEI